MANIFDLSAKVTADTTDFEHKINGLMGTVGKLTAAATAAVGAFAGASVKTGMEFDKSVSQVAATMGMTMEEMEQQVGTVDLAWGTFSGNLRDYAQEMGANTAFSAKQSADALNYMALAGYDVQTSMEMLPNVLNLAAAGDMDLARASDMVTDTQTAFGISLDRTSQMVDEMAKAASTGNTSVEQLGDAFLVVGGLAQELNGGMVTLADGTQQPVDGLQELEIALTAMANAGVKGSEAGTHMRNMLLKLSSPTAEGTKQLEKLGVKVFDTNGQMRSLKDVMGDLDGALGNLTQEQKIQAISDLFNTRDLASAEALLNAVSGDWDEIGESILDAQGAAQKMADTQLDNLAGDITLFKSALEGVQIAISDEVTPALREFVQFGSEGLSKITKAIREEGLAGGLKALGELIPEALNMVLGMLPQVVDAGVQLMMALVDGIIQNLPAILDASVQIIGSLASGIVENLPTLLEHLGEVVVQMLQYLNEHLPEFINAGLDFILSLIEGFGSGEGDFFATVADLIMQIISTFVEHLPEFIEKGKEILISLGQGIIDHIPEIISIAVDLIIQLLDAFLDAAPQLLVAGMEIIAQLIIGLVQKIPDVLVAIGDGIAQMIETFANSDTEFVSKGMEIILSLIEGIINNLPQIITAIGQVIITIASAIVQNLPTILQKGIEILGKLAAGIIQAIPNLIAQLPQIFSAITSTLGSMDWASIGWNLITGIANGVRNGASNLINSVISAASSALSRVKSFLGIASPSKKARDEVGKMFSLGLGIGFEEGLPVDDMVNSVADAFDEIEGLTTPTLDVGYKNNLDAKSLLGQKSDYNEGSGLMAQPQVTINVYATERQDEREIAREVENQFMLWNNQRESVFA